MSKISTHAKSLRVTKLIIKDVFITNGDSLLDTSWRELKRFQNQRWVSNLLMERNELPKSQARNARKQAVQIKYCLSLAREYYQASDAVGLSTKPVLLYYAAMNFALAEILMKQSGDSSLDKARNTNRHHGLVCRVGGDVHDESLEKAGAALKVTPMVDSTSGSRKGTFELWHRSARTVPTVGRIEDNVNSTNHIGVLDSPFDERPPLLSEEGVDLLYCLRRIPKMHDQLRSFGIPMEILRGRAKTIFLNSNQMESRYYFHPYTDEVLHKVLASFEFAPALVPSVDFVEEGLSSGLRFKYDLNARYPIRLPAAYSETEHRCFFHTHDETLNEFGLFYVSLFAAGTFARYYPEKFIAGIEQSTPLSLAIEELTNQARLRLPVLAASEMCQKVIFPRADRS